jgi:glycosyltransferase involved in cell wall biosynthesis
MKLAYLTTRYPAVSHTFIRREILEIERRGHRVQRLAIRKAHPPPLDPQDAEELRRTFSCLDQPLLVLATRVLRTALERPGKFLSALMLAARLGWRSDRGLLRHLAYLLEAASLLGVLRSGGAQHLHAHFGTNSAAVARLIHRLGGPGYSFTVHGPDEFDNPRGLDLAGKVAESRFVVGISHFTSAQIRRWCPPEHWEKIRVVRCVVGVGFFAEAAPLDPASRTLVCVGRLSAQKGQLLLLEAFQALLETGAKARLVLAGDGEMRPLLEERIARGGLSGSVEITGWISEDEVRRRILQSRAMVLPSFAEGLPVVIMEALALGRPVISSFVAGIPELVRPGENGWLVPAGNQEALTRAMEEALRAPPERLTAMGQRGRDLVKRFHHPETEGSVLETLFLEAVGESRLRPPVLEGSLRAAP